MPIKGVSEVIRLSRLGKIRLGIKKETEEGISYPVPTDHFVCPEEVRKIFGEKPSELRIMFPTEDEKQWSRQYLKCYSASQGLICRGDGETALAKIDINTGKLANRESTTTELREIACSPARCAYYEKARCRRVMNLQFLLPECPGFGVYQLDTGSYFSIVKVNSCLKLIRAFAGRLSMIPLLLQLVEEDVQVESKPKRVRILNLSTPYSLIEIQKYAQLPPGHVFMLPAPDNEAPDDLFPEQIIQDDTATEISSSTHRELIHQWDRVKRRVWQMEITDSQIANWFQKYFKIEVRLDDFDELIPPSRIKTEYLEQFLKILERQPNCI